MDRHILDTPTRPLSYNVHLPMCKTYDPTIEIKQVI